MAQHLPFVRDITPGTNAKTLLLVAEAALKQARNGPFWFLELKDATGSLEARIWNPLSREFADIPAGSLVEVEGRVELYREKKQLTITRMRVLEGREASAVDASRFVASSRISPPEMLEEVKRLCLSEIHYGPWREAVRLVFEDEEIRAGLFRAPAARGIHHAWAGGLLEHTLSVARLCMSLADRYPFLDRQILLVAALFHDLGKLWELTADFSPEYSDEGRLIGHIALGVEHLSGPLSQAGVPEPLRLHLKHMILSHHGQLEYGSPRLPQTAEALALHHADNIDARLTQYRTLMEELPEGSAWTSYQKTLDRQLFRPQKTAFFEAGGSAGGGFGEPAPSSPAGDGVQAGNKGLPEPDLPPEQEDTAPEGLLEEEEGFSASPDAPLPPAPDFDAIFGPPSEEASFPFEEEEPAPDAGDAAFFGDGLPEGEPIAQEKKKARVKAERKPRPAKDRQWSLLK